jgi:hypothetical protein
MAENAINHYDVWALALIDRALHAGHFDAAATREIETALENARRISLRHGDKDRPPGPR